MNFSLRNLFVAILFVGVALTMPQTLSVVSAVLVTYALGAFSLLFLFQEKRWDSFLIAFSISLTTLLLTNEFLCWYHTIESRGPTIFPHRFENAYPFAITFGFLVGALIAWFLAIRREERLESNIEPNHHSRENAG